MFRSALKLKTISKISKQNREQCLRYYTTDGEKGNSAKVGLIIGSSVVIISGLTIGYAKYDSHFRTKMQNSVPFSTSLLNTLFGPLNSDSKGDPNDSLKSHLRHIRVVEPINQNSLKTNTKTIINKEDKTEDNSPQIQQTIDSNNEKIDNKNETKITENDKNFLPQEDYRENNESDISTTAQDLAVDDIDISIASDLLKDQLKAIFPSDDEQLKELQKKCNDIELEYQRKISKLEEKFELESKNQLRRQLSAFNEHLVEQMNDLRHRLKRNYENSLEEKLLEEKTRFQSELQNSFYRIQVMDEVIEGREKLERDQHPIRQLWVLCQALKEALSHRPSMSEECSPISLNEEITAVESILKKNSLNDRPLVRCALEGIPKDVIQSGVYSEEDLIKRFTKVDKYCRRVALIGDEGGNLYHYLVSYIQSLLIFRDSKIPTEELDDKEVDPSKWDTFDILTRVRHSLNNHNLEMALKYANQLRGEPRNVAKDWIRDTRMHLEVRQSVDLLQTEADAINVQIIN